jgi:hypothetical protein
VPLAQAILLLIWAQQEACTTCLVQYMDGLVYQTVVQIQHK